jgi:uncharacterized protein (DUF427 family)
MAKAVFNGETIAESDLTEFVENNYYFPPDSVKTAFLEPSEYHTDCPWKGRASYYHVQVGDKQEKNAAWYYPAPKEKAAHLKDFIAFWKGVKVTN